MCQYSEDFFKYSACGHIVTTGRQVALDERYDCGSSMCYYSIRHKELAPHSCVARNCNRKSVANVPNNLKAREGFCPACIKKNTQKGADTVPADGMFSMDC
ncbi:hypothetical protein CC1G_07854 [Coprinopsis cinerea okayama7|uniref:Uncharacterized protein n=1 Tax=Coprinopsis cinerea (strain Okayama-7 / 130 / ATCC MYA-4618 / FGSC 9003) TaxID=240176 RepID=A8P426_COPC7|nr:hypothetical protein CC1G_07854 [Coprinopsis cinerea okayama7\|eukprot:XP_001838663.1 hypothetical protein CC1G_07854 [Coprinopsis cinerea okayama7\